MKALFLKDKFIISIILLNALIIFIQGFDIHEPLNSYLDILDSVLTILFSIEMVIKIKHFGIKDYFSSKWNIFDFSLIVIALPSLISLIFISNLPELGFLLAFRIFRVFKFFRFIRFVPGIEKILKGAAKAAKASVIILIGFFIFNFTISLISCFFFKDVSPDYFGNPILSFYSIFKVFTIEGWYEIPDEIVGNIESNFAIFFIRLYFIIILFLGGIFGLSLVNSIFVDTMISDNNDNLEKKVSEMDDKLNKLIELTNKANK